jgi:hypothetical protein
MKDYERVDPQDGYDEHGRIIYCCRSGGYVMVKRPKAKPFVLSLKEWAKVSREPLTQNAEG